MGCFELDSEVIIDIVNKRITQITFLKPLFNEVLAMLHLRTCRTSDMHTYREANMCDFFLANHRHQTSYEGVMFTLTYFSLNLLPCQLIKKNRDLN